MTREEFIKVLEHQSYSYVIEGDKIIITHRWLVYLEPLMTLPSGVEFRNEGYVNLGSLETIPPGVEFRNKGDVWLRDLTTLPSGVGFSNKGDIWLNNLKTISPGVVFSNDGDVWLSSLVGGWFGDWKGNIEGINNQRLLNLMISKGVFI